MNRRDLVALGLASPFLGTALAQSAPGFPNRHVRLIAFGEPGGPLDILGRVFAERLSKAWGHPVVVDDVDEDPVFQTRRGERYYQASLAAVPLLRRGTAAG